MIPAPLQPSLFDGVVCVACRLWKPHERYPLKVSRGVEYRLRTCKRCVSAKELARVKALAKPIVSPPPDTPEGHRRCGRCEAVKPLGDFYFFRSGKLAGTPYTTCKACADESTRKSRVRLTSQVARPVAVEQACCRCGLTKPASCFQRQRSRTTGLQPNCKECVAAEKVAFLSTPEGKFYNRLTGHQRRASSRLEEAITFEEWNSLKERFGNSCLCCGKREPEISLTMDHVVPLSKGGLTTADNIQPLCKPCNSTKGTRDTDFRRR